MINAPEHCHSEDALDRVGGIVNFDIIGIIVGDCHIDVGAPNIVEVTDDLLADLPSVIGVNHDLGLVKQLRSPVVWIVLWIDELHAESTAVGSLNSDVELLKSHVLLDDLKNLNFLVGVVMARGVLLLKLNRDGEVIVSRVL